MAGIKILSAQVANLIAAGEVVQRPASVVKELMENAIDAGADKIDLIIKDSGRTLINVIDNGCGMSRDEAVLCFERHATSKIAAPDDLQNIHTFGFRGEALPSIAAVSQLCLKSRREQDECGTQVRLNDPEPLQVGDCACPKGSNFEVRNLFFNTPARRKFLKSDTVEFKHIVDEFSRIALCRPDLNFSLSHNGREIYRLKSDKSLKFRVLNLLGNSVADDLVDIVANTSLLRMNGLIGRPESARKSQGNQFFFVNGRFFRSAYLHKAVMNAYSEMIPDGLNPSYVIFLSVDPQSVDVNISPNKTEVKFENEAMVFQTIYACVRETLGRNGFGEGIDFEAEGAVELPQIGQNYNDYRAEKIDPNPSLDWGYNPFESESATKQTYMPTFEARQYDKVREDVSALGLFKEMEAEELMVVEGKYIVKRVSRGLMLCKVSRAKQRILYEQMLRALKGEDKVAQITLFPLQVQVGAGNVALIEGKQEMLSNMGFDIRPFGSDSVIVSALPLWYDFGQEAVEELLAELLQSLEEEHSSLPEMMQSRIAGKLAQSKALSAGGKLSQAEAKALMDKLMSCNNTECTPSGKKICRILGPEELDKLF